MRILDEATMQRVEKYNIEYQKAHGLSPSFRQIMHALNLGSLATVQRYVKALENVGRIKRTRLGTIEPIPQLKPSGEALAPLIGKIACGEPNFEVENIEESFMLPRAIFGSGELFMLRTYGNSMIDAGIEENDLIVLRKQNYANDGDIVVALVNGENTLKRLFHRKGKIILHPENKTMNDIMVENCNIQGVLVGCIKTY